MKLTEKRLKFCEEYIKNGYNGTKAYMFAYDQDNKNVAAVEASRLLKDPRVHDELNNVESTFRIVGYKAGITKAVIMRKVFKMLDAIKHEKDGTEMPDNTAINNAIVTYAKLTGDFTERRHIEVEDKRDLGDIDPTKITSEERKALKEKLLKEL